MKSLSLATAAISILALLSACGDDDGGEPTESPAPTTPSATATATQAGPTDRPASGDCADNLTAPVLTGELSWDDILPENVPAPEGWAITDVAGDAPLLAAAQGGIIFGTLELLRFEIPFDANGGYEALLAWAEDDFYAGVVENRDSVGLSTEVDSPQPVSFGDYCGIAYAYTSTDDAGALVERFAARATFDNDYLYIVTAFYDAADQEVGFISAQSLGEYEPGLTQLVESLQIPAD